MSEKSSIIGARYVLAVKDLAKSVEYYEQQLGFKSLWTADGWHSLGRENFIVMLGECADDRSAFETRNHSYFAYIDVQNIDDLYEEYRAKGLANLGKIGDRPWGMREFMVQTVDGHRIMFGEAIKR